MELTGIIKSIGATESKGANGFKIRELIVMTDTDTQYPQPIKVDFVKDKCELLDKFGEGQSVKVHINLRGSEYMGKYYVSIQGWKIESN